MIKRFQTLATDTAIFSQLVAFMERIGGMGADVFAVLTYHRVDYPDAHPELDPTLIGATPELFDEQMRYLVSHYHPLSMPELLQAHRHDRHVCLPPRAVLVTFDDAYTDFAQYAWPILKRHGIPATLFVPTAFPDHPERVFWWDQLYHTLRTAQCQEPLHALGTEFPLRTPDDRHRALIKLKKQLKALPHSKTIDSVTKLCTELGVPRPKNSVLGWDALRQLMHEGVTLGSHTQTHPLVTRISTEQIEAEAIGSRCDLERFTGIDPAVFAYPGGALNQKVMKILENVGFSLAFTTGRGINDLRHTQPFMVRRINVGRRTTLPILRAQMLPWSKYLNPLQRVPS